MLARIRKAMEEKDEGFTLIELLVVVIIIGILAAIAIPVFLNQRQKAVQAGMKADLRTVANEEETYFVDKQAYSPATTAAGSKQTVITNGNTVSLSDKGTSITSKGLTDATTSSATDYSKGYCLTATNTSSAGNATFYYNSLSGGLTTTACP